MKKILRWLSLAVSVRRVVEVIAFDLRAFGVLTSSAGLTAFVVDSSQNDEYMLMFSFGVIIWLTGLALSIRRKL